MVLSIWACSAQDLPSLEQDCLEDKQGTAWLKEQDESHAAEILGWA